MKRAAAFAVLALIAVPRGGTLATPVPSHVEGAPEEITAVTVAAVHKWVTAVEDHVPGKRDASVETVSAWTFEKRTELNTGMPFFLSFLRAKPVSLKTPAQKLLAAVAAAARQRAGADAFLKRAAVLHSDAAFKREIDNVDLAEEWVLPAPGVSVSPLLSQRRLFLNYDGEILGETVAEWNWAFARSLLDLLSAPASDDPFVATWYHATTAFMFRRGLSGEAVLHLERAAIVLPDDAQVLFDRACYSESQGLPHIQVLLSDQDVALRASGSGSIRIPAGSGASVAIPAAKEANDEAERLFRRALRADPAFVEARVRLGRLLSERKRHEEAASELATALAAKPTGFVLFHAHLFAGRAAQALGKIADAAGHYRAAALLFPGAQSAELALSQAALLESDVPAVLESIQRLDRSSTAIDPWWSYHLAAGRDADALLRDLWTQASR